MSHKLSIRQVECLTAARNGGVRVGEFRSNTLHSLSERGLVRAEIHVTGVVWVATGAGARPLSVLDNPAAEIPVMGPVPTPVVRAVAPVVHLWDEDEFSVMYVLGHGTVGAADGLWFRYEFDDTTTRFVGQADLERANGRYIAVCPHGFRDQGRRCGRCFPTPPCWGRCLVPRMFTSGR